MGLLSSGLTLKACSETANKPKVSDAKKARDVLTQQPRYNILATCLADTAVGAEIEAGYQRLVTRKASEDQGDEKLAAAVVFIPEDGVPRSTLDEENDYYILEGAQL